MENQATMAQNYVRKRLSELQNSTNEPAVRRDLAILRRGAGKSLEEYPEILGVLSDLFDELPEESPRASTGPSYAECAAVSALCLFAVHQQGKDLKEHCMDQKEFPLGRAVRKLAADEDTLKSVRRRFNQLLASTSIESCTHYLRSLVQLLRSKDIPLSYPDLAKDLYWFQIPKYRDGVRFSWGRDFYRTPNTEETGTKEKGEEE